MSANHDWKKEIPPEWVDTIAGDIEKQRSMTPQGPFSEAYMSGMPASKRRKVRFRLKLMIRVNLFLRKALDFEHAVCVDERLNIGCFR